MKKIFGSVLIASLLLFGACQEENFEEDYTYQITDAWWSDALDFNGDGYAQSEKLHFSTTLFEDVSRKAYGRIYYRRADASEFSYYASTDVKLLNGGKDTTEFQITIGAPNEELPRGEYEFKIEIYEENGTRREASADASDTNFVALKNKKFEKSSNDKTLDAEVWWEDLLDVTNDGYARSGRLVINVDCDTNAVKIVNVKLFIKEAEASDYRLLHNFPNYAVEGNNFGDTVSYFIGGENQLSRNLYDFRVEVYDAEINRLAALLDAENSSALNDVGFETEYEDVFYYTIKSMGWTNVIDNDADGYARSRDLFFDVDVDKEIEKNIYAKIYCRHPDSTDYSLYDSTDAFTIFGISDDADTLKIGEPDNWLDSAAYDFLISVYEIVNDSDFVFVTSLSSGANSDLKDVKFENVSQDGGK